MTPTTKTDFITPEYIFIHAESKELFRSKVNQLLTNAPEWISNDQAIFQLFLDKIPNEDSVNYTYKPQYSNHRMKLVFNCTVKDYNLEIQNILLPTIKKQEYEIQQALTVSQLAITHAKNYISDFHPEVKKTNQDVEQISLTYHGPLDSSSISKFPKDLQEHANKLAKSEIPFNATVLSNGNTMVTSKQVIVNKTLNMKDLLLHLDDE
ncbi:hypothetical protein BN1013_02141 [Candidatus Rubidus massiliensis]|nr:hypothetical protein BN1013_02141 [Candidatus Rubidus massiliensis]